MDQATFSVNQTSDASLQDFYQATTDDLGMKPVRRGIAFADLLSQAYYGSKYWLLLLNIFKHIFGFSFVVWRCFFSTVISERILL